MRFRSVCRTAVAFLRVVFAMGTCFLCFALNSAERKAILILHSYHPEYPWTSAIAAGINAELSPHDDEFVWYSEYLDARRTDFTTVQQGFYDYIQAKHGGLKFYAVIATDRAAVQFVVDHGALFPAGTTKVFNGIARGEYARVGSPEDWSGVYEDFDVGGSIEMARKLIPGARRLLVVYNNPATNLGGFRSAEFDRAISEHAGALEVERFTGFTFDELFAKVASVPDATAILVAGVVSDRDKRDFTALRCAELARVSKAPIFTSHEEVLNYAGVGGSITSAREMGVATARLALELVREPGTPPKRIGTPISSRVRFDGLQRWGIPRSRVPAGVIVTGEPPGILPRYGWEIATAGVLFAGLIVLVVQLSRSVRERRLALEQVSESESLYRGLVEQMPDAVFLADAEGASAGTILSVNKQGAAIHGYTVEEMVGKRLQDIDTPEAAALLPARLERMMGGETLTFRVEHFHKDGSRIPLEVSGRIIRMSGKARILAIDRDMRMRDRQERRFRELAGKIGAQYGQDFLKAMVEFISHEFDMEIVGIGQTVEGDPSVLENLCTFTRNEFWKPSRFGIAKTPCADLMDGRTVALLNDADVQFPEDPLFVEHGIKSYVGVPLRAADGRPLGLIACGSARPISAHAAEELLAVLQVLAHSVTSEILQIESRRQLEESELHYRRLIEISPTGIVIIQDGLLAYANPAAGTMAAVPESVSLVGDAALDFVAAEDLDKVAALLQTAVDGGPLPISTDLKLKRPDGVIVPVEVRSARTMFRDRPAVVVMLADQSERQRAEEQRRRLEARLQQANKMEAIGTLAGGIAHDFNNILAAILGNLELAEFALPAGSESRQRLTDVRASADRARHLVSRMLAFGRQGESRRGAHDLGMLVAETMNLMRPLIPSSIEMKLDLPAGLPSAFVDPTQIQQVVLNLSGNAVQAMEGRNGVLEVTLSLADLSESDASALGLRAGSYLMLSVADSGLGMDESVLERIFEPFFTTKAPGAGTGLGLAMVHGTIREHQGAVRVSSAPGHGSTFQVLLPVTVGKNLPSPDPQQRRRGNGEHILVVDDESIVARVAVRFLENLGYTADVCTDSRQAVGMIANASPPYAAIISDLTMPHLNGIALLAEIRKAGLSLPVLLSSGYSGSLTAESSRDAGFAMLLQKPYSLNDLASAMAVVLGETGDSRV